ncbi:MAG: hypothetical protein ABII71_03490 [Candidatus Micrarchaeota archaeon]
MKIKLEFGSKWFYIAGFAVALLLCVLFFILDFMYSLIVTFLLGPFIITGAAYLAIGKAGIAKEKWYIIMNSVHAFAIAAGLTYMLFFVVLIGPFVWDSMFAANEYVGAIGGTIFFAAMAFFFPVFVYLILGSLAAYLKIRLSK